MARFERILPKAMRETASRLVSAERVVPEYEPVARLRDPPRRLILSGT